MNLNKSFDAMLGDMYDSYLDSHISAEDTECGHDVSCEILDELGYVDHLQGKCHHCHYQNGDISKEFYYDLCNIEEKVGS